MEFRNRLKELREMHSMSQAELADALGVSVALIGMYESGRRNPSKEKLEAIADYFNVSLDYINGNEDRSAYYLDPETAEIAEYLHKNKDMKVLLDSVRDMPPEDAKMVADLVSRLSKRGEGNNDT